MSLQIFPGGQLVPAWVKALLIVIAALALITAVALIWRGHEANRVRQAEAGATMSDGRTRAAGDASQIRDGADARDADTRQTVKETIDAIQTADDRDAARAAALRGLCRLDPGADARCRVLLADPGRVD